MKAVKAVDLNNIIQELELEIQKDEKHEKHEYYRDKDLLKYFVKLVNSEKPKIHRSKSKEFLFTLKQFLNNERLSVENVFNILKTTDYHASSNKISHKISKFYELNLIKKTVPSPLPENPRETYYKLTSYGLFYLLKDIREKEDIKNIFKIYGDDDLFRIFLHPLIEKELLSSLQDIDIIWIFIEYAKQICNKISKELEIFKIIQKNGKYEEPVLKWDINLKNDNARWLEISDRLLSHFFLKPPSKKPTKLSRLLFGKPPWEGYTRMQIKNLVVTDTSISFDLYDNKINVELDKGSEEAILRFNKVVVTSITIKRERNYFALYSSRYKNMDDYAARIKEQFFFYVIEKIQQLVVSLQQLYFKPWDHSSYIRLYKDYRKKHEELEVIAKVEKIKNLMIKFNYEMLESFKGFLEYSN